MRKTIDIRNEAVCASCKEPVTYDPKLSIRAIDGDGLYRIVCSVKCRRKVQGGVG